MSPSGKKPGRPSKQIDLSSLFTRTYEHAGREVTRPMWFYISLNKNGYAATRRLIMRHGGKVSAALGDRKTSKEICLVDPHAKASRDGRPAYSVDYIQSCITARKMLNMEDFRIPPLGTTRKTPSKQQGLDADRKKSVENRKRQVDALAIPEVAQTKDSEVTDDLLCLAQLENDDETSKTPAANGESTPAVLPDETPLQETGETDRGAVNEKEQSEGHHKAQAKPPAKQPDHRTPKKRRSPDRIQERGEKGGGNGHQEDPSQVVTPVKDTMNWTKSEDDTITQLCIDTKNVLHDTGKDPNDIFTLACWVSIARTDLLPPGRSAKACFARAVELWKNGGTQTAGSAERVETAEKVAIKGGATKRARLSPPQTRGPEDEDDIVANRDQPQPPLSRNALPERLETGQREPETGQREPETAQEPETKKRDPKTLKNASRLETREYIFELVARIAKRGRVTKRKAFRALRDERGHWKRALRLVTRRKS